jgi:predicted TIM-barrel fold metal-dependent hydrolase
MSDKRIGRRKFIKGAGLATLAAAGATAGGAAIFPNALSAAQEAVPNTSGTELPKLKAPPLACDCHQHIYDPARFPPSKPGSEPHATVADYRLFQKRLGLQRNIIATPRPYQTDNSVTIDAIAQFAPNARGAATVDPSITDAELEVLNKGGIRAVRFGLGDNAADFVKTLQPLAKRVSELGWHVDLGANGDQLAALGDLLMDFPSVLVFDHMGRINQPMGVNHPGFAVMMKLLDKGRTYVKLSMAAGDSKDGPPTFADVTKVAQAYVKAAPERMIWGSNWPHPGEANKPDDAVVFDLLSQWAPDEKTRHRILVDNPAVLYGFAKS